MVARYSLILLLVFFLFGCGSASPSPTIAPVVQATLTPKPSSTNTPAIDSDTVTKIRNAEYQLGATDSLRIVQLADGKFEQGTAGGTDYISVNVTDFVARGDLNNDGANEFAALVAENYGGSGVFVFLTIFSDVNGKLAFQTSTMVDDRPMLNALSIENGEVFLDATIHGIEDPMCCPTLRTTRHYRFTNKQLDMTDYATFTPAGNPRTIKIESPASGSDVFSAVQVKGNVTVAPFENTLTYKIYDVGGVELSVGSLTVSAPDPGAPGTFESLIPLGNILSGAVLRIKVQDVSAADGSLLAMDSVELVVK